jgi:hypothetical protein
MVLPSGGTPPYSILWDELDPNAMGAGDFLVEIVDANDCMLEVGSTIDSPPALTGEVSTTPSTEGDPSGTATLEISGGAPGYSIVWSTGATDTTFLSGLAQGEHSVAITDANDCTLILEFTIDMVTGLPGSTRTSYVIFPVPASNTLTIRGGILPRSDLVIIDMVGRTLASYPAHPLTEPVPVGTLAPGRYTLVFRDRPGLVQVPFIRADH